MENNLKTIKLTQNRIAVVDDDIYEVIKNWKWHALSGGPGIWYANHSIYRSGDRSLMCKLHHIVAGHPIDGKVVDHINGDGLDNRRDNLRIVSISKNIANSSRARLGQKYSSYTGVTWYKKTKKWKAQKNVKGKTFHLGYFYTEEEASNAYLSSFENQHA